MPFAAVFRLRCMFVLSFVFWYVCSRLFLFSFSLAFCFTKIACETLCKFLYAYASLKCIIMQGIMVNRKLFGNFGFSAPLQKRSIFLLFVPLLFLLFWIIYRKIETETKKPHFCLKTSVFVANKTLFFSDLYLYRVIYTPPPRFWHSQGGSALFRNFLFFYFLFFVKYSDFSNSAFLPNFEHFPEYHIYFSFCIKSHSIYFCLFPCVRQRFMQLRGKFITRLF